MQNFLLIVSLVAPVFIIVGIGVLFRKAKIINDNFIKISSKLVFNLSLPALVFSEISRMDMSVKFDSSLLSFAYLGIFLSFFISWIIGYSFIKEPKDRTVFIQGSFRGNFAVIGLALIKSVLGNDMLGKAALVLAVMIPMYNVLSIIALTVPLRKEKKLNLSHTFLEILKNPLIIAVLLALPFSFFEIQIHHIVNQTLNYLADLTMPLALIGIGGFIELSDIKKAGVESIAAVFIKNILTPAITVIPAVFYGMSNDNLGILFILFSCPTAIASFIMAEAMGSNSKLAANILLLTTLASVLTITAGLFLLKEFNLI